MKSLFGMTAGLSWVLPVEQVKRESQLSKRKIYLSLMIGQGFFQALLMMEQIYNQELIGVEVIWQIRMKAPCLGTHLGWSLNKNLVARTCNLGALGDRAPIRQQPWHSWLVFEMTSDNNLVALLNRFKGPGIDSKCLSFCLWLYFIDDNSQTTTCKKQLIRDYNLI